MTNQMRDQTTKKNGGLGRGTRGEISGWPGGGLGRGPGRLQVVAYLFSKVAVVVAMIAFSFENQCEKLSIMKIDIDNSKIDNYGLLAPYFLINFYRLPT